jgi:hypothetical protein
MKRGIYLVLFLLLFLIPFSSAVSFDMKTNYSQGETFIAKITGNFVDAVSSANVFFYRDGYVRIPIESEISKLGSDYYIYAQLSDKAPGNYSISIENARHTEFTNITNATVAQNFSITSNKADFSITPGFVSISNTDSFSIQVNSLKDSDISISVSINDVSQNQSTTVSSYQTKQLPFSLSSFANGLNYIQLSHGNSVYNIPVYALVSPKQNQNFQFEQDTLNITLGTNQSSTRTIFLQNIGKETLSNIKLYVSDSLSPYITLSMTSIPSLEADASVPIQIIIPSQQNESKIQGSIRAEVPDLSLLTYSQISLNFVNNYISSGTDAGIAKDCASISGKKCNVGESCSGYHADSNEGVCCLGTCQPQGAGISGTAIVVIVLILLLGGLILFLVRRKNKAAKKKGPKSGVELLTGRK